MSQGSERGRRSRTEQGMSDLNDEQGGLLPLMTDRYRPSAVLAGTRPVRQCRQKFRPHPTSEIILRDESNFKPAPLAHRFAASGLTFSSPRNDGYQVGE